MNELTQYQENLPMTAEDITAQRDVVKQIMAKAMVKDVHFGVIPGTQRPTLLKVGSDMLLSAFHIAAEPVVEDLSQPDVIHYRVRVRGTTMGSGNLVGVGIGEASSNEEKYKWRKCHQREFDNTPENRRRTKYYGNGNAVPQVRTEPADVANTVLKMAKKRAQIDLTLTVLAAGDIFTNPDASPQAPANAPQRPQNPTHAPAQPATSYENVPTQDAAPAADQDHGKAIYELRKACDRAGLREIDVWAHLDIVSWGDIKPEQIDAARQFIEDNSP